MSAPCLVDESFENVSLFVENSEVKFTSLDVSVQHSPFFIGSCILFGVGLYFFSFLLVPLVFVGGSVILERSSDLSSLATPEVVSQSGPISSVVSDVIQRGVSHLETLGAAQSQIVSAFVLGALAVGVMSEVLLSPILHSPDVHRFLGVVFARANICSQERFLLSHFLSLSSERDIILAREVSRDLAGLVDRLGVVGTPEQVLLLCLRYPEDPSNVASRFS